MKSPCKPSEKVSIDGAGLEQLAKEKNELYD
jgi:hypothetical protein